MLKCSISLYRRILHYTVILFSYSAQPVLLVISMSFIMPFAAQSKKGSLQEKIIHSQSKVKTRKRNPPLIFDNKNIYNRSAPCTTATSSTLAPLGRQTPIIFTSKPIMQWLNTFGLLPFRETICRCDLEEGRCCLDQPFGLN